MLADEVGAALRVGARLRLRRPASARAGRSSRASAAASSSGHIVALDDPLSAGRFAAEEIESWRDAGPVLLRSLRREGGRDRGARHRPQGHRRAAEQRGHGAARRPWRARSRRRSRTPGCTVSSTSRRRNSIGCARSTRTFSSRSTTGCWSSISNDRVVRWNTALEQSVRRAARRSHRPPLDDVFDAPVRRSDRAPRGATRPTARRCRACRCACRGAARRAPLASSTPPSCRCGACRRRRLARSAHRHRRGHHAARAARRAAADLREDGVDRPAGRRRGARGQHAAHRHFELHADAARRRGSRGSADAAAREDRATDVPRRQDRQRPAQSLAARPRPARRSRAASIINTVIADVLSLLEHQFAAASRQGAPRAERGAGDGARHRAQAAAGVPEPVPQRQGRDAEGRLAVGCARASSAAASSPRSPTPAPAFRPSISRASTIRSSRRRRSARAPASGCRSPTASSASTKGRSTARASVGQGTRFILAFPPAAGRAAGVARRSTSRTGRADMAATAPFWSSTTRRSCARSSRRC